VDLVSMLQLTDGGMGLVTRARRGLMTELTTDQLLRVCAPVEMSTSPAANTLGQERAVEAILADFGSS
jgi:hypothetical protein